MGIYIKGIDMPKNGDELLSIHIYPSGKVTRQFDDKCNQIAKAMEVTPPHGDLIDKDAIQNEMYHKSFETDDNRQKWDSGLWIRYKIFEEAIADVPAIIEVEK